MDIRNLQIILCKVWFRALRGQPSNNPQLVQSEDCASGAAVAILILLHKVCRPLHTSTCICNIRVQEDLGL